MDDQEEPGMKLGSCVFIFVVKGSGLENCPRVRISKRCPRLSGRRHDGFWLFLRSFWGFGGFWRSNFRYVHYFCVSFMLFRLANKTRRKLDYTLGVSNLLAAVRSAPGDLLALSVAFAFFRWGTMIAALQSLSSQRSSHCFNTTKQWSARKNYWNTKPSAAYGPHRRALIE